MCNTLYVVLTLNHTDRDDSCQQLLLSNCTDSEPVAFENPAALHLFYLSSLIQWGDSERGTLLSGGQEYQEYRYIDYYRYIDLTLNSSEIT